MFPLIAAICLAVVAVIIMVTAIVQRVRSKPFAHMFYRIALMVMTVSSVLFAVAMWEVQPLVPRIVSGFLSALGSGIIIIKLTGTAENYFAHTIEGWLIVSIGQMLSSVYRHDFILLGCWAFLLCFLLITMFLLEWDNYKTILLPYKRERGRQ